MTLKDILINKFFRTNKNGKIQPNNASFRPNCINRYVEDFPESLIEINREIESVFGTNCFDTATKIKIIAQDNLKIPVCVTCSKELQLIYKNGWKKYCSMSCCQKDPETIAKNKSGQSDVDWGVLVKKREQTMMDRYGVSSASQLSENKIKISLSSKEYYSDPDNVQSANQKREQTNIELYGVPFRSKDQEFHNKRVSKATETKKNKHQDEKRISIDKYRKTRLGDIAWEKIGCVEWCREQYITLSRNMHSIGKEVGCSLDAVIYGLTVSGCTIDPSREPNLTSRSFLEIELFEFVQSIYPDAEHSVRINRKEMDICIPELKLGIEFHGVYWHSEIKVSTDHHKNKYNHFRELGYRLIQIWEDDWVHNKDVVKKFINNQLSKQKRIGARKTSIREITQLEFDSFMSNNHMQGTVRCGIRYGLFLENDIVAAMGFTLAANNTKFSGAYNLVRFANTNIVGAFGKILKNFISEYKPKSIRSYADLELVSEYNNVYIKNGFAESGRLGVDYTYFNPNTGRREHKFGWRKTKFKKLGIDITGKTEHQLAQEYGLLRCYDSGKICYELKIDNTK